MEERLAGFRGMALVISLETIIIPNAMPSNFIWRPLGTLFGWISFANPVAGKPAGSALARLCVLTVQAALAWATPAQSRARRT